MKTKVAYKFSSKHLGKAFMEELLEMGYKDDGFVPEVDTSIISVNKNEVFGLMSHHRLYRPNKVFNLESQYAEALAFAREQIEPEFEVGKWYYSYDHKGAYLFNWNKSKSFGFFHGIWQDGWSINNPSQMPNVIEATKEEIQEALIKEAERRYDVPCIIKYLDGNEGGLKGYNFEYDFEKDSLYASGDFSSLYDEIYCKGKWAELIEDTKFFDWDVEEINGFYKIGCETYSNHFIKGFIDAVNHLDSELTIGELKDELKKINL
ncbi:MAG TPA: hypothetical protein VLA13_05680 [Massilibacterium sp.]|nr:hypothetical protein [Massilibacterium sp.]